MQTVFAGRKKSFFRYRGLQHIDPQHPPDEEDRDDCADDMNDPVAKCLRFAKIKHEDIVAPGIKQGSEAIDRWES